MTPFSANIVPIAILLIAQQVNLSHLPNSKEIIADYSLAILIKSLKSKTIACAHEYHSLN